MFLDAAIKILEKRYLEKNDKGEIIETPEERFEKVADEISKAEKNEELQKKWKNRFLEHMLELNFLPNSPTLMNAGKNIDSRYKQYCACTVIDIDDNMESIGESVKEIMLIHKTGAGTGMNYSKLRPKGSLVSTTKGKSSGPIEFMKIHNSATEAVKQGGVRRGANIGLLEIWHPDIIDFINLKSKPGIMENFNLSIGVWDDFIRAILNGSKYRLHFPGFQEFDKEVDARELFNLIVKRAWESGEPGLIFLDTINRHNPTPELGPIRSTNPCGEVPLYPYEACNLGSINLSNMIVNKKWNYKKLDQTIEVGVRFLDNIVDLTKFPIDKFYTLLLGNRKIGLGVMGWADALLKLGIPYDSEQALNEAESIMKYINSTALDVSKALGEEKGNFPNFEKSIYKDKLKYLRNASRTVIAPTGSISRIAGVNYGIEPLYEIETTSRILNGEEITVFHPIVKQILEERNLKHIKSSKDLPQDLKEVIRVAHEISPEYHVLMQAAFQKYTDNAVSKTVNLPYNATEQDVYNIFMLAWEHGCKGITVYRDGSRKDQPVVSSKETITINKEFSKNIVYEHMPAKIIPKEVATDAPSRTIRVKTGCGKLFVDLVFDETNKELTEVFITTNKNGGCKCNTEALAMAVSALLRCNVDPMYIVKLLKQGDSCVSFMRAKANDPLMEGRSCPDAIGRLIEKYIKKNETIEKSRITEIVTYDSEYDITCPDCGKKLRNAEGCIICPACGYSRCN
ncbi:adenosylcobalamin-dependent ribonucleoside-diphosphate reductase [Thermosipho sp. (in: thermotogales)]|jgi:ribonucleoside-diphosphate reductase alpha chain|uniref:adenosylcobalamin-dependent ribonucleoside-diphosphate reductase n=1 Tax=Thermosipho sp. (in: thermotogales) TaxID=1968895 RepID=UPI00257E9F97|nr:adenosylcobalamin-dependent ribonucleoside-diphosphate reductase [Thermosipho sp. (in: thermotogales)]MBZ4649247.1 nrdZ [Thermosipho sp. (in: thermotogales)]